MIWIYLNFFCLVVVGFVYLIIVIFRFKIKCGEVYWYIRVYEINCYDKSWGSF